MFSRLKFIMLLIIYGLLTKREVKIAGYRPSSVICVVMDLDFVPVHKHANNRRPITSLWERFGSSCPLTELYSYNKTSFRKHLTYA